MAQGQGVVLAQALDVANLEARSLDPADQRPDLVELPVREDVPVHEAPSVDRGAFGAPTFFAADEMFWGQDRLDFVRAALTTST